MRESRISRIDIWQARGSRRGHRLIEWFVKKSFRDDAVFAGASRPPLEGTAAVHFLNNGSSLTRTDRWTYDGERKILARPMWTTADRFTIISVITSLARTYTRLTVYRGNCGCQRCSYAATYFRCSIMLSLLTRMDSVAQNSQHDLYDSYHAICIICIAIFTSCLVLNIMFKLFQTLSYCICMWLESQKYSVYRWIEKKVSG